MSDQAIAPTQSAPADQTDGFEQPRQQRRAARKHAARVAQRNGQQQTTNGNATTTENMNVKQVGPEDAAVSASTAVAASPEQSAVDPKAAIHRLLPSQSRKVNDTVGMLEQLTPGVRRFLFNPPKDRQRLQATVLLAGSESVEEEVLELPAGVLAFVSDVFYEQAITGNSTITIPLDSAAHDVARLVFRYLENQTRYAKYGKDGKTDAYEPIHIPGNFRLALDVYLLTFNLGMWDINTQTKLWFRTMPLPRSGARAISYEDLGYAEKVLPIDDFVLHRIGKKVSQYIREDTGNTWNNLEIRKWLHKQPKLRWWVKDADRKQKYYERSQKKLLEAEGTKTNS